MLEFLILIVAYIGASYLWMAFNVAETHPKVKDTIIDKIMAWPMAFIGRFI